METLEKKLFLVGVLKVTNKKEQDLLVKGTDPGIRIQIRTKMSRIQNTAAVLGTGYLSVEVSGNLYGINFCYKEKQLDLNLNRLMLICEINSKF
jgi:hypothetical protein